MQRYKKSHNGCRKKYYTFVFRKKTIFRYMTKPDYIFETSWEVCNKVGGIYTVLSSRAATMARHFGDNVLFVGPCLDSAAPQDFTQTDELADFAVDRKSVV